MFTPAQKPRGLARISFTSPSSLSPYRNRGHGRPPTPTAAAGKRQRHPAGGGVGVRFRGFATIYLYSTLETFTQFLPSFSVTMPVTVPSLASWQVSLWYFLLEASK